MTFAYYVYWGIKMAKKQDYTPLLKKIVDSLNRLININKEHKEIGEKQLKQSMTLFEQRFWTIMQIVLIIGIGSGIIISLNLFGEEIPVSDYAIDIKVNPNRLMLNEEGNKEFEFTFTNIGMKNITDFRILDLSLYRQEANEYRYCGNIVNPSDGRVYMTCDEGYSGDELPVGKSCKLKEDMRLDPKCLDDKDKPLQFFIIIESKPPINNALVNITIY